MFSTRPDIIGTFGVVSSTHWLASSVGMSLLEKGGNAFDAAVAAGFMLQLVEPHMNGPGGEVPVLLSRAGEATVQVLCGQGVAPKAATIDYFRSEGLDRIPRNGLLATVVPGAFDAWMLLLRDHGTVTLDDVLGPAIHYAGHGHPMLPRVSATIAAVQRLFTEEWTGSAEVYLPGNQVPAPGRLFRNPRLAHSWQRLLDDANARGHDRDSRIEAARDIWRRGWVAEAIDRFCRQTPVLDDTGHRRTGLLTGDDLATWQAQFEAPIAYDYGRYRIHKCGPWSQGPVMLQQLALLKGLGLDDTRADGPEFVHLVTEAAKLAFADREVFYGDPNFVTVPLDRLLSEPYNDVRRRLVADMAAADLLPGMVSGEDFSINRVARRAETSVRAWDSIEGLEPPFGDTCHLDVIDRWGNMVAATPSGGWLQSSPVIPELGFCLNTRAQMFWLDPESPSALGPGRRPRTTLTPSLAFRDGEPWMAFGTPGGDQQDQWTLQFFLHLAHHGMSLQQAIDSPGFHSEHFPGSFFPRLWQPKRLIVEDRFPEETLEALRLRGHDVTIPGSWSEGRVCACARENALLYTAASPRGMQSYAVGR